MEIVFRASIIFLFLWMITRVVGRSTIGELSTFQLILFITMGDMVQQAVTQQDYSVTAGILAVSTFAVLTMALSWMNARWPVIRAITHGVPVIIVQDGLVMDSVLRKERMSLDDLKAAARQQGFETLAAVRLAVLEANGQISFFTMQGGGSDNGQSTGGQSTGGNPGAEEKPATG